jgi:hypothetical protein
VVSGLFEIDSVGGLVDGVAPGALVVAWAEGAS